MIHPRLTRPSPSQGFSLALRRSRGFRGIIWDGMWHAFMNHPELPESREAATVIGKFFASELKP